MTPLITVYSTEGLSCLNIRNYNYSYPIQEKDSEHDGDGVGQTVHNYLDLYGILPRVSNRWKSMIGKPIVQSIKLANWYRLVSVNR